MRFVTFALALLTLASGLAMILLMADHDRIAVLAIAEPFAAGLLAAVVAESSGVLLTRAARVAARRGTAILGHVLAAATGCLPLVMIVMLEERVVARWLSGSTSHGDVRGWLVAYGSATVPWLLVAWCAGGHHRTLRQIHAFGAQALFLLLTACMAGLGLPRGAVLLLAAFAALPPALVGALIAAADPAVLPSGLQRNRQWLGFVGARGAAVTATRLILPNGQPARTFLFLQGPHGSFFPQLAAALRAQGQRTWRINFNGGDHATWPDAVNYSGTVRGWPGFVRRCMRRRHVTDLVLYGDVRPQHAAAIDLARATGVRVHVFEEGYLRPDWVTLEREGVNGHSRLPRDPAWFVAMARQLPPLTQLPPLRSVSATREWAALFYYIEVVLSHWRFPFYASHRTLNPAWEAITYLRRYLSSQRDEVLSTRDKAQMAGRDFFLFPLQLTTDFQIRHHSPFGTMKAALRHVMASFARHAPATALLAIKEHPLEYGTRAWRRRVGELAATMGLERRVVFLEQGDLQQLVAASKGMVTVNSTSGTLALAMGKPVKVLGNAVYDITDITDQHPLDRFWADPRAPDPATYDAFCRVLAAQCLLPGAFLSSQGMTQLVAAAVQRLLMDEHPLIAVEADGVPSW